MKDLTAEQQVDTLLYLMGPQANDVVDTFGLSDQQKKVYATVMAKFEALYADKKNTVYERAKFNRCQQEGEPVNSFIMDVKRLAANCEFGALKDELIRGRIILDIADEALSQSLQLEASLDLEKMHRTVTQNSNVVRDNGNGSSGEVNRVINPNRARFRPKQQNQQKTSRQQPPSKGGGGGAANRPWICKYCGKQGRHNKPKDCPAFGKKYHVCKKWNHFASVCKFAKSVHEMEEEDGEDDDEDDVGEIRYGKQPFLGTVCIDELNLLLLDVKVGGYGTLELIADGGADATVMGKEYLQYLPKVQLEASGPLRGAGRIRLDVLGKFKTTLRWQRKQRPLLGRPAMLKFKLIDPTLFKKPEEVMSVLKLPEEDFQSIFDRVGEMPGEYTVKIKPNNEPFSIKQAPAVPLLQPTTAEVLRMEAEGIITQVDEALPRCAGMVPVLKKDGSIEKEALSLPWTFERLSLFLNRLSGFELCTDHKPLIPILSTKPISDLSPRLQRFRMRLLPYVYDILHVPGKELHIPDILSSANVDSWPVTPAKKKEILIAQQNDQVCSQLSSFVTQGWPRNLNAWPNHLKGYFSVIQDLNIQLGAVCNGNQILIPKKLQTDTLQKLHAGHLAVEKCRSRASSSVWWPGMSSQLAKLVEDCETCAKRRSFPREPLLPSPPAKRPWEVIGMDFTECKGRKYLVVVDYFSTYPFALPMTKTTAAAVINELDGLFSLFGAPDTIRSDNGPPEMCVFRSRGRPSQAGPGFRPYLAGRSSRKEGATPKGKEAPNASYGLYLNCDTASVIPET
ncbi:hypothetical protein KUF71_009800 [Frankliniella fusca]|uniref:RNA-directed DNA polymerase n=1 Tax=Frankliniella fusca TaxID=407009 RepID=A0AAE1HFT4_9NEOP|nr:hypothetical protein KUF71_009800 [Frankliniella fusca]